jgi:hypothetical protein
MPESLRVTLAALLRSDTRLFPHEAVAIALELCGQVSRRRPTAGVMAAISTSTVVIDASGAVSVNGGVPGEDEQSVSLVGRLLVELLEHPAGLGPAVPPRLRATARKAASDGAAAYASLAHLAAALRRHGPEEGKLAGATRGVVERCAAKRSAPAMPTRADAAPGRPIATAGRPAVGGQPQGHPVLQPTGSRRFLSIARLLAVGMALLLLAGAALVISTRQPVDPPPVLPAHTPLPVSPNRHRGWELIGKPSRVSTVKRDPVPEDPRPPVDDRLRDRDTRPPGDPRLSGNDTRAGGDPLGR